MSTCLFPGPARMALALAAALFVLGPANATAQQTESRVSGMRALEPGDAIRVSAWREEEMSGEYTVDEDGAVVLPMLGTLRVTGLAPAVLERRLKEQYAEQLRNQEVDITFLRRVSVLGSVGEPGLYLLDPTMRLSDALALAGGADPDGKPDDTRIFRAGVEVTNSVDPARPLAGQLRSGDEIRVPRSSWLSRNSLVLGASLVSAAAILLSATVN